ncbi:hypothetical protein, partial [Frankia sp. Cr1]|uniref:hypothetical protein n=1 Tax=Frankia sp. Cr1 TaxID=3073931 RepID=UPI002AD2A176
LLTTHTPGTPDGDDAPGNSTPTTDQRYHRHLPPHPDPATLTDTIHALLTPTTDDQTHIGRPAGLDNHQPPTRGSDDRSPAGRKM